MEWNKESALIFRFCSDYINKDIYILSGALTPMSFKAFASTVFVA